jgi:hypothetical protein
MASVVLGLLPLVACGSGTETGNPDDTLRLGIGALPGRMPRDLMLDEAVVSIPSAFFMACPGSPAPSWAGPAVLDLLAPGPLAIDLPSSGDTACGTTVQLGPSQLQAPAALSGLSFRFSGVRGDGVPFEIRSAFDRHYPLVPSPSDTPLDARHLFVGFDLSSWLDAAAVPALPVDDGFVVLDPTRNVVALTALESAGVDAIALYLDSDGNGVLDASERTPVGTAP